MVMKKAIFLYTILLFFLSFLSCKKGFLDQLPDDRISIDDVFARRSTTERYLGNIYNYVRTDNRRFTDPWTGASDEVEYLWFRGTNTAEDAGFRQNSMNIANWDPSYNFVADFWGSYYRGIRSATYFMGRVDECTEILNTANGAEVIKRYKAEARALRAYFYSELLRIYGPVVLLGDEVIDPDAPISAVQVPRNSMDECVAFVVSEMDKALPDIPLRAEVQFPQVSPNADVKQMGRVTKGFALAVKSRTLLLAASPLFNGNADYAAMKNADGKQLISTTTDPNKWVQAAAAAKAVMDLGVYSLYTNTGSLVPGQFDPYLSCRDVLIKDWNTEVIFARTNNALGNWQYEATPRLDGSGIGGGTGAGATQKMVDAYFMANGKSIDDAGSGYQSSGFSTAPVIVSSSLTIPAGTYRMYTNREPRFYVGITYNGSTWINTTRGLKTVELYYSGNSGRYLGSDYSPTGYVARKNVPPDAVFSAAARSLITIRLAEFYLNYAEAQNEVAGPDATVYAAINAIRSRAGVPDLQTGLTKDQMRDAIRKERRVELAFENHRYFDTRRWKIAETTDNGPFYGLNINAGSSVTDLSFYQPTVFEIRVFQKKHYLFPIPQGEINKVPVLVQNTGW